MTGIYLDGGKKKRRSERLIEKEEARKRAHAAVNLPKGRWHKSVTGERMYEVGRAYRDRAERMQRRPATVIESPRAKLMRELRARSEP